MTAARRRVRVVIEGEAHEVSTRCEVLRVDLPRDSRTGLVPTVMVSPDWEGVSVEDVAPSYNWQDGDVIQDPDDGETATRHGGRWRSSLEPSTTMTDGWAANRAASGWDVLRYQAGAA